MGWRHGVHGVVSYTATRDRPIRREGTCRDSGGVAQEPP